LEINPTELGTILIFQRRITMKKIGIIFAIVMMTSSVFAATNESSCLTLEEQKTLGQILIDREEAYNKNPECAKEK
jgi:hypothetical protein